jgi:hypothetical protein
MHHWEINLVLAVAYITSLIASIRDEEFDPCVYKSLGWFNGLATSEFL